MELDEQEERWESARELLSYAVVVLVGDTIVGPYRSRDEAEADWQDGDDDYEIRPLEPHNDLIQGLIDFENKEGLDW
jgi:hypothetical protein